MGTRWTPMAVVIGLLAVVLAGAGVVAVVAHEDDDRPVTQALTGADQATTTSTVPDTTTSTAVDAATTTSSPPTTTGRTTTTRATSTTVRRTTTTTARPAPTTTLDQPLCTVDQIDISTTPGRLSYPAGETVTVSSTIRNKSSSPCFYQGYQVEFTFRNPAGAVLVGSVIHADDVQARAFTPGQAIRHDASWNPGACGTSPCPVPAPGIYSVEASWSFSGGRYGASRQYVLT